MAVGATCSACSCLGRLRSRKLRLELRTRTLKACSYIWPPGVYAPKVPQVPQTVPLAGDQLYKYLRTSQIQDLAFFLSTVLITMREFQGIWSSLF